jgi:hypothetical protein
MHFIQNQSGLLSQLEIDDHGIELSVVQKAGGRWYLSTNIRRNGQSL